MIIELLEGAAVTAGVYRGFTTPFRDGRERTIDAQVLALASMTFGAVAIAAGLIDGRLSEYETGALSVISGLIFIKVLSIFYIGLSGGHLLRSFVHPDEED